MKSLGNSRRTLRSCSFAPATYIGVFLFILYGFVKLDLFFGSFSRILFHAALFLTGLFSWTFFEYMAHRYLLHSLKNQRLRLDFNHRNHHSHPGDIRISGLQRSLMFIIALVLLAIAAWMDNFFTLIAGFLFGFPLYALTHFFLHKKKKGKVPGKLATYHIYNHCKYPHKCFGITVTWWDDLFGSVPENPEKISPRVIDFFFASVEENKNVNR